MPTTHLLSSSDKARLKASASKYDFLRFSVVDMNGTMRGKLVPRASVDKFIDHGLGIFTGVVALGHDGTVPHIKLLEESYYGNCNLQPALSDVIDTPWSDPTGKHKVGMIMCETVFTDTNKVQEACPRTLVRTQIERLADRGLSICLGFEFEFHIRDAKTKEPIFEGNDIFIEQHVIDGMSFIGGAYKALAAAGLEIENLHPEYSSGSLEFVAAPKFGLDAADKAVLFKECVNSVADYDGLEALTNTKLSPAHNTTGTHLSHSLWDASGRSLLGEADSEEGLSELGRYWLGGLIKHGAALCALYAPTVDCYQRWGCAFCPLKVNWGFDDRHSAFRVKRAPTGEAIIENRLPSGSSNPYLTTAATIAAGLDGIENKLEPPKAYCESAEPLPTTLGSALQCLEQDEVMVTALGSEFVSWYCQLRRDADLKTLDDDVSELDESALANEVQSLQDLCIDVATAEGFNIPIL